MTQKQPSPTITGSGSTDRPGSDESQTETVETDLQQVKTEERQLMAGGGSQR